LKGYFFEKENIFYHFINHLYEMKKNRAKDTPNYLISKLLMNSLYGRLGMNPTLIKTQVVSSVQAEFIRSKEETIITNSIDLKNGKELITFFDVKPEKIKVILILYQYQ
jgi:DNA polymerase type B, organellar and viral